MCSNALNEQFASAHHEAAHRPKLYAGGVCTRVGSINTAFSRWLDSDNHNDSWIQRMAPTVWD